MTDKNEADSPHARLTPEAQRAVRRYVLSFLAVPTLLLGVGAYVFQNWIEAEIHLASHKAYEEAWTSASVRVSDLAEKSGLAQGKLERATDQADELDEQVDSLNKRVGEINQLSDAIKSTDRLKTEVAQIIINSQELRAIVSAAANQRPLATYTLSQPMLFHYGPPAVRVNFDRRDVSIGIGVVTGSVWRLTVPLDGFYLVSTTVSADKVANIHLVVQSNRGSLVDTSAITDPNSRMTGREVTRVVQLRRGDAIWVEVTHSMSAGAITGGEFTLVYLRPVT